MRVDVYSYIKPSAQNHRAAIVSTYELSSYNDIRRIFVDKLTVVNHIMTGDNYVVVVWVNGTLYWEYYRLDIKQCNGKYEMSITTHSRATKQHTNRGTISVSYPEVDAVIINALEFTQP